MKVTQPMRDLMHPSSVRWGTLALRLFNLCYHSLSA